MEFTVPDYVPYLLAVLGLLLIWQLHQIQITAGRIKSNNFWEKSGIRMFIFVSPQDDQTCQRCKETHGLVLLPALRAKKNFSPLRGRCSNPSGCRCQMIGLYGSWPQAQGPSETWAQVGPGTNRARAQVRPGPKWDPGPSGARAQVGPGPKSGPRFLGLGLGSRARAQ